jgi:hypothetical protein
MGQRRAVRIRERGWEKGREPGKEGGTWLSPGDSLKWRRILSEFSFSQTNNNTHVKSFGEVFRRVHAGKS